MTTAEAIKAERARKWMVAGLSALVSAIALSLGTSGPFSPTLAVLGAILAGIGLHRLGRSGPRGWVEIERESR